MSFASALLRVLLSLSLFLNGVSAAEGGMGMHVSAASSDPATIAAAEAALPASLDAMPCHQHETSSQPAHDDGPVAKGQHGHATPDCCKSGSCRCDCVHAAQAGPLPWSETVLAFDGSRSIRPLALAHATPELPHLIRPPIG